MYCDKVPSIINKWDIIQLGRPFRQFVPFFLRRENEVLKFDLTCATLCNATGRKILRTCSCGYIAYGQVCACALCVRVCVWARARARACVSVCVCMYDAWRRARAEKLWISVRDENTTVKMIRGKNVKVTHDNR